MQKKLCMLSIIVALLVIGIGSIGASTDIIDSMDFQGETIELTLEQAVNVVTSESPTIKESELDLKQAQVEYEQSKRQIKKSKQSDELGGLNSASYLEAVTLPLLTADYNIANVKRNQEATIEGLKADIEKAYFNVLHAERTEQISKESLAEVEDTYKKTKQKAELGMITRQDVLDSELSYIKAKNSYSSAINAVKTAKMELNAKLGYNVMANVVLKDELEYKEFNPGSIAEAVSKALENRKTVKSAEYSYHKEQLNMDIIAKKYTENTYMYREQQIALEKALKDLNDTKKDVEIEVRKNYMDVLEKQEEIKSAEKSVEISEESLKINKAFYETNMISAIELQEAETSLAKTEVSLSKAILDYNLAVLEFENCISVGSN